MLSGDFQSAPLFCLDAPMKQCPFLEAATLIAMNCSLLKGEASVPFTANINENYQLVDEKKFQDNRPT